MSILPCVHIAAKRKPSLKTKSSQSSIFLKTWRPFPDLSRRLCGGSGSFKEYHGLFNVFGVLAGESSTRTCGVVALMYICASLELHTGRQCPLFSPCGGSFALRQAKQDSKLVLDKGATSGNCFPSSAVLWHCTCHWLWLCSTQHSSLVPLTI